MLGKRQLTAVTTALGLVILMFFGFEYKPDKIIGLEKSRSKNIESTGIENLILQARETLSLEDMKILEDMRTAIDKSEGGDQKIENTKLYASKWFELGYPVISAYYAEDVAKAEKSADSWAIAGTSYILGMKKTEAEKEKNFAFNRAISAFEKAISLDPENLNHKINLALVYVEKPLADQPMKGIMMLRDLNSKHPENVSVIVQLARLAVKTGQWDRAQERLNEALSLDSQNLQAICLMAEVLTEKNNKTEAQVYIDKCENIKNK
jgi:tetratricopeptide (TPR) repeat protein